MLRHANNRGSAILFLFPVIAKFVAAIFSCLKYRPVYKPEAAGRGNVIRVGFFKQENIAVTNLAIRVMQTIIHSAWTSVVYWWHSTMREFKLFGFWGRAECGSLLYLFCKWHHFCILFAGKVFSKKYFEAFKRGWNTVSDRQSDWSNHLK